MLIQFSVSSRYAETIADALSENGALSVAIESATDEQRLQVANEHVSLWSENRVTGIFPEHADAGAVTSGVRKTSGIDVLPACEVARLDDADWGRAWMAHYQPQCIAPNLWITPSWCVPPDPAAVNVVLDPGLAFGTGTHATTRLCLNWLATQPLAGRTVIDYGCGSGILAIAALKLGAARALGVDVDPRAIEISRENAGRNGVVDRFAAYLPDELSANQKAEVVVANILSETLIVRAGELAARTVLAGRLGLSGILTEQAAEVRAAYAPNFDLNVETVDGWALLAGCRNR